MNPLPIREFLHQKTLLLTGATGFLGKTVVEKLLREAPELRRIYLLIRPRGGAHKRTPADRLREEVMTSAVFDRFREELGDEAFEALAAEKIVAVAGDLSAENLGMDPDVRKQLCAEIDIFINSAASVVFDEPLDSATKLNSAGPMHAVRFAKECRDAVFVHVSTAYVNGQRTGDIPEDPIVPAATAPGPLGGEPVDAVAELKDADVRLHKFEEESKGDKPMREFRRILKIRRGGRSGAGHDDRQIEVLRRAWVRERMSEHGMAHGRALGWNDSYTLTKALGERLLAVHRETLPTVVVRPSIIESSLSSPQPGWIDGLKVLDPLIVHYSKGKLPDFPATPEAIIDIIPVDFVVNAIIAVIPRVREIGSGQNIPVVQVATGSANPVHVRTVYELVRAHYRAHPVANGSGSIKVPDWSFPSVERFERGCRLRYLYPIKVAGKILDSLPDTRWVGSQRRKVSLMEAAFENAMSLSRIYAPYSNLRCRFVTDAIGELHAAMDPGDREAFSCDVSRIQWQKYFQDIHIPGLERHVLKKDPVRNGDESPHDAVSG